VRDLYNRLLDLTKHVKVWISFAEFEHLTSNNFQKARQVFKQANEHFKSNEPSLKHERKLILETWLKMESDTRVNKNGANSKKAKAVQAKLPRVVLRKRATNPQTGSNDKAPDNQIMESETQQKESAEAQGEE